MRRIRGVLLIIGLLFGALSYGWGNSASNYHIKSFTVEEDLPQSQVLVITQDEKGYLWLGTNGGGIVRYDGYQFINFTINDGLSGNVIYNIAEGKKGELFIATNSGISYYSGKKTFQELPLPDSIQTSNIIIVKKYKNHHLLFSDRKQVYQYSLRDSSLKMITKDWEGGRINDIAVDPQNHIWVSTQDSAICEFKNNAFTCYANKGFPSTRSNDILIDNEGNIWAHAYHKGLVYFKNDKFYVLTENEGLIHNSSRDLMQDERGYIWHATFQGMNVFDPDKLRFKEGGGSNLDEIITYFNKSKGLSNQLCWSVFEDRENNIWIGTNDGLNKVTRTPFSTFTKEDGLPHNVIFSIEQSKDGKIWLGTARGGCYYNSKGKFNTFKEGHALSDGKLPTVSADQQGRIWYGTNSKGVIQYDKGKVTHFDKEEGLVGRSVWSSYVDSEDNLWFGTYGSGVSMFDGQDFTSYNRKKGICGETVRAILEDQEGNIWLGTNEGCLTKLIKQERGGTKFVTFNEQDGLPGARILSMTEDDKGNIWMATYAGVVQYDGDHFIVWNKEQGLSSNTVYLILFDKTHKNIWAGTNNGLNKLNVKKLRKKGKAHFKHYGKEEGFLGLECNPDAVEKDNRNNIWFGTVNGLVKFNPRKDHKNLVETKTNITNIRVELQDTSLPQKATLPYYKNQITFNFSGICLTNPEKVKYKYKLEGFDNNWSPVTKEQVAHYTNLSPGTYTFKVKSCNNEGIWNRSPTTFKFTIAPPFWRTKEFYAVCLILLFSGLYGGHKIRVRKIEQEREKLETKVAERTQELEQKNEQLEKLSLVASRTDNGIIIADAEGNIEWINEGYTRLTGYTLKEIRSEKGSNVMEISAHPEIQNIIEEAIEDKVSQRYEAINYTKGGDKIWVASTLTPITDKNNEVRKLIIIDTDITEQKEAERIIRQKNKDITDSIRYAKRIQEAILPKKEKIKQAFPESFIFYQPRDMVSGDFYWFHRYDNVCILAAVDCTGHGVPGALMSMIGNDLLNQIVIQNQVTDPATILSQMNKGVTNILNTKNEQGTQDGMDMGICKINMDAGDLVYSGALRPLYIVRAANNKFEEIKGNTWSVGGHINTDKHFENVTLTLQEGDMFYLFSDGYPDQFGGEKGKKFMIKNFKSFLHQIASYKAKRQEENLKKTFQSWKKDEEQVDDILVMGVKYV